MYPLMYQALSLHPNLHLIMQLQEKKQKLTSDFDYPEVSNEPVEGLAMSLDDDGFIAV